MAKESENSQQSKRGKSSANTRTLVCIPRVVAPNYSSLISLHGEIKFNFTTQTRRIPRTPVDLSRTLNVYAMPIPLVAEILDGGLFKIPYALTVLKTLPCLALTYLLKTYFGGASNRSERVMHSKVIMMTVHSTQHQVFRHSIF